ncbi:transposase [Oesophagostomum dentatum]|uniref:Transposase n=1 Tax=Oesophagostomum dentatum TaxID=61180 RepID=A0A0B1TER0_OESDE|nr:transposase [Oesophagostomum dentatum]
MKKPGPFVPHRLGQLDCDRRVDACTPLLALHKNTNWMSHQITEDKKMDPLLHFAWEPRKAQWVGVGQQAQDVPKHDLHIKKIMVTVWWNIHGVVHWQLLNDGATITANLRCRNSEH